MEPDKRQGGHVDSLTFEPEPPPGAVVAQHWSDGISRSSDRQRVLSLERLLREIRAGGYGCSTQQLVDAITETLGDGA